MKRSEIPSLDDLRAFEAVVRNGSVRGAAQELALTHGAISRRVAKLAQDLDIQLLVPSGRGIAPTAKGAILAQSAQQSLTIITDTLASLRDASKELPIVLSCERSLAMRWLIPRLSQFQDQYTDIPVHLSVGGGSLNFVSDNITLAIRRIDFPLQPHWKMERLFDEEMGPVMQPAMVAGYKTGSFVALAAKTRPDAWNTWHAANPGAPRPVETRLLDHHFLLAEAAAGGLGVAMCPHAVAMDDLSSKRLAAPDGFSRDGSAYGLLYPKEPKLTAPAKALADWIKHISP